MGLVSGLLRAGVDKTKECLALLCKKGSRNKPAETTDEPLRLVLGSPSTTGCVDVAGNLLLNTLTCGATSIQAAFRETGLHAIGMPGARLRPNFNAPADASFAIFAKGDGTYDSVAVAVQRQFLKHFSHLDHVGSNRRMWLRVTPSGGPTFLWLVFYLPANNDAAWKAEAEGILSDATTLLEQLSNPSGVSPGILLSGDANFQPFCICRVRDPKPQREATFQSVLSALNAVVVNPICEADDTVPLQLPLRNKTVRVRSCDTHHCCGGSGASRAIDLICTSSCLPAEVCIHNGVHCKGLRCTWDLCIEYTRGDHFLIKTLLPNASVSFLTPATVSLPSHWREERNMAFLGHPGVSSR